MLRLWIVDKLACRAAGQNGQPINPLECKDNYHSATSNNMN